MTKVTCEVCGREIDSRGLSGHMKTHIAESKGDDTDGVISYPSQSVKGTHSKSEVQSNEETKLKMPPDFDPHTSQGIMVKDGKATTIHKKKKAVKKTVASKPASSPASSPANKPDPRGQRKTETEHKKEWQGFFRD